MKIIEKRFLELCDDLAAELGALHHVREKEKKKHVVSLYFRMIKIQLVYSCKWTDIAPPSVLYCRIYPDKNAPIFLHLPEMIHYLQADDFRPCYYPYIESKERMERCFYALAEIIRTHLANMEELGASEKLGMLVEDWLKRQLGKDADLKTVNLPLLMKYKIREEFAWVARFTIMDGYQNLLHGDDRKIRKLYKKREKLSPYEEDLLRFLDSGGKVEPMPPECDASKDFRRFNGQMQDWKGILLLYPPFAILFCVLLAVVNGVLSRGALFFSSVPWWIGLLLGFLPPIFCYPLVQSKILAMRFRKERKQALAFLKIASTPKWIKWMSGCFFAVVLILELWFCVAVPPMAMRMYEDYGIYYTENGNWKRFSYDQVTAVYHIAARYNQYEERVERDSYVLLLADGTTVDMDCEFGDIEGQHQVVTTLFPELLIQELDSDRDLP